MFFFFNDTATTEIYTLSLHDALPICTYSYDYTFSNAGRVTLAANNINGQDENAKIDLVVQQGSSSPIPQPRSEEHTSELQSRQYLVCRLLLEKKTKNQI